MQTISIYLQETLPERFLIGLELEGVRYILGTLGVFITIWVLLAPLLEQRRIREPMNDKRLVGQIKKELLNSLRTICIFIALDIIVFDLAEVGIFKTYSNIEQYGWLWFYCSIPLAIILHDTYFYWAHRAMHHKKLFRVFHLTHHRSNNPTPFTAYSFAFGEAIVMYAYIPILMLIIPMHVFAITVILLVMIFKNAIGHCGYELFPKNTLNIPFLRLNTTVTHHDMHHEKANGNYGFYFTWWDKWMGTEHIDYQNRFLLAVASQPTNETEELKSCG